MLGCLAAAVAAVSAPMVGLLADAAGAAPPSITVTEVSAWGSGNSPYAADWFELTNTGASPVTITGWKMDDDSASFASAVALNGITSIAAGESVIFIETTNSPNAVAGFKTAWFGNNVPGGLQIGTYSGSGVGLSTTSDAVTIFDSTGTQVTKVTFNASDGTAPFQTFDNAAGVSGAISTLSVTGTHGAFVAANDANEIGSPGTIGGPNPLVPEVPYAVILPAGAILVLGAGLAVRRLRRRPAAA
jgi:hypothetical protein